VGGGWVAAILSDPLVNASTHSPPKGPFPDPDACIAGVGVGEPVPKTCKFDSANEDVSESGIPLINEFSLLFNLEIVTKCRMRYWYLY
jgi:hypothetical protein